MSTTTLSSPLNRLNILPNNIKWRGGWVDNVQYYFHDAVISPENGRAYILTEVEAILGGLEPTSVNSAWTIFSGVSDALVTSISAGAGILVNEPQPQQFIIANDGVRDTIQGNGIVITGTTKNPTIRNTGPTVLVNGGGIAISGVSAQIPQIDNTGIISLVDGDGIDVAHNGGQTIVSNSGVTFLKGGNSGIVVIGTETSSIGNTGVLSVTSGTGIQNNGTATQPILENTGVLTLSPASPPTIVLTQPTPNNYVATLNTAKAGSFVPNPYSGNNTVISASNSTLYKQSQNIQVETIAGGSQVWVEKFTNGDPNNGCFVLDLTSWTLQCLTAAVPQLNDTFEILLSNGANGPFYTPAVGSIVDVGTGTAFTSIRLGKVVIDINTARTIISGNNPIITVKNDCSWDGVAAEPAFAISIIPNPLLTYYPQGVLV